MTPPMGFANTATPARAQEHSPQSAVGAPSRGPSGRCNNNRSRASSACAAGPRTRNSRPR
eukprot:1249823-Lingulodinium_polyedra.AAC.1